MPAQSTRQTLNRQWELLKKIPNRGTGKTASELVADLLALGFTVSKRQVERDLRALETCFPLECQDKGLPHGWRWREGCAVDLPGLSAAEALSLRLIKDTLQHQIPAAVGRVLEPRFALADAKLSALDMDKGTLQWPDKIRSVAPDLPMLAPSIPSAVLETVQEALLADEQLEVTYASTESSAAQTMLLHPLVLLHRAPATYLAATAWDYPDVRLYALHRMQNAVRLYVPATKPSGFDADRYIAQGALQFGHSGTLRLRAKVSESLARHLQETPLTQDQQIRGRILTATVHDTWQLAWWILGRGPDIEVLKPLGLRQRIRAALTEALAAYTE